MKQLNLRVALIALLFSILSFQMQSCKGENKDASIQTAIASKTATDPNLQTVSAAVVEGIVTLTGQCKDESSRQKAENVVKDIEGVKKVVNNITVTPVIQIASDKEIRDGLRDVMSKYGNIQADVNNGIIILRGEIKQNKIQQLMMELNTLRPKRIENQLFIK